MLSSFQSLCTSVGRRRLRQLREQPARHLLRHRLLGRLRALEAIGPALHLAREEALRLAERSRARSARDRRRGSRPACRSRPRESLRFATGSSPPPNSGGTTLRITTPWRRSITRKSAPISGGIVAVEERARRGREGLPELRERAVLALHVVRAGGDGAERRPAQHVLARARARAEAQQIGEIRVAAAELAHRERLLAALEPAAQPLAPDGARRSARRCAHRSARAAARARAP